MKWGADVGGKRKQLEKKGCKVLKVENKENKKEGGGGENKRDRPRRREWK